MNIKVELSDPIISQAARIVISHHKDPEFLDLIANVAKYNHTSMTSVQVSNEMAKLNDLNITIKPWRPLWWRSNAIARASYKDAVIEFNVYKIGSLQDRVETILHEATHLIGFTHDGNYVTPYNLGTVPYLASAIFIKYLKKIKVLE